MSPRTDSESSALISARKIMAGLSADACRGRVFADGGREWERIRWLAFRHFVLIAPGRALHDCWRTVVRALGNSQTESARSGSD